MKQMTESEKQAYQDYVKRKTPVHNLPANMAKAFVTGGIICVIGQMILNYCEKLGLDKDTYSISIPLGATINMGGAAITISILALAAANTLEISVDIPTAIILCVLSALSACGASGVAGGSLLLIPLACSLFGIPNDLAMQVVGVGFIIGVIQDSCETALNSSTDVLFTAAADMANKRKK